MDKTKALQKLLNGIASEEDVELLKRLLASGEISIGGNVNQAVIIIGSGNTVELPPEALDRLNARPILGNLGRDLTGEEIALGLRRLEKLLPNRAPVLIPQFKAAAARLRPNLKTDVKALSESARRECLEALAAINSICVEALDVSFNGLSLGEAAPDYDARSPFRGLESFRPEDSEFFFGREALTRKLVAQIQAHPFLAVLGASGSGKSSLVMAGVIPTLDSNYVIFRPGTNPLDELESARGKSLIVVDQFEELFTLTREESARKDFIARLLDESAHARIILTLRSDFLGEVGAYRTLSEEIQNHLEIIPPMDMDELRRAMEGQAGMVGLRFEADLSQQILDDVEGEPGAMPLLQHALWELWNRRHGRNLRASEYRAFGGVKQAITSTAEKLYADCSKPEQDSLRDIFLRLTRLDEGDEGRDTRRRVPLGDLIPSGVDTASISVLLDKLATARLIVKSQNGDVTEVEVVHEALIRHWERLRSWINDDRVNLRLQQSVIDSAHEWDKAGRDEPFLTHHGPRLDAALSLGGNPRYGLTSNEHAYLIACQVFANKQEILEAKRKRNIFVVVTTALLVITAILAAWGINRSKNAAALQEQVKISDAARADAEAAQVQAETAQMETQKQATLTYSNQLVAQSAAHLSDQLDLALLLAAEAFNVADTPQSESGLLSALTYSPTLVQFIQGQYDQVYSVSVSPDGKIIASCGPNGLVYLWDSKTGLPIGKPLSGHIDEVNVVRFSPDGRWLASGDDDGMLILWDLSQSPPIGKKLLGHTDWVIDLAFSPNSRTLVSVGDEIFLWSLDTFEKTGELYIDQSEKYRSVAFDPVDPNVLVTGGLNGKVILWNIASGTPTILGEHVGTVRGITFSPDGKIVASNGEDSNINTWDVESGTKRDIQFIGHTGMVYYVQFSPKGILASAGEDKNIILWDVKTGEIIGNPLRGHSETVLDLSFSKDGSWLASGGEDQKIGIWSIEGDRALQKVIRSENQAVSAVGYSGDGRIAVSASDDRTITRWDANLWQPLNDRLQGHTDTITTLAVNYNGDIIATGDNDKNIILWKFSSPGRFDKSFLVGHTSPISSLQFNKNGSILISIDSNGAVLLWDVAAGKRLATVELPEKIYQQALSHDGAVLALAGKTRQYFIKGIDKQNILDSFAVLHPDTLPTDEDLADTEVESFLVSPARDTGSGIRKMVFSPDDTKLAMAFGTEIYLRDVQTEGFLSNPLEEHSDPVVDLSFSADGSILASLSADNQLIFWDLSTRQVIGLPVSVNGAALAFAPSGLSLLVAQTDGNLVLWEMDPQTRKRNACKVANRNLTEIEKEKYLTNLSMTSTCPDVKVEKVGKSYAISSQGWDYYHLRDYEGAIPIFENAIALDHDNFYAFDGLGWSYYMLSDYPNAIKNLEKAKEINPYYLDSYDGLAWSYWYLGDGEKALDILQRAVASNPYIGWIYRELGWIYFNNYGDYETAIKYYEKSLALQDDDETALKELGRINDHIGNYTNAIDYFNRLLRIDPEYAEIHKVLGDALFANKQPEKAIQSYKKAIELSPDSTEWYNSLSTVYIQQGNMTDAEAILKQAIQVNQTSPAAYDNLAEFYEQQRNDDLAIKTWQEGIHITNQPVAFANLGDYYYYTIEDYEKALEQYKAALVLDPKYEYGLSQLGWTYNELGQKAASIEVFESWMKSKPESEWVRANLGNYYYLHDDYEKAEYYLKEAIKLYPSYKYANARLGNVYYKQGKYEQSITSLQEASYYNPFEDGYYYDMARAYYALGRPEDAYVVLTKGITINPVDPYVYVRAGNFYRDHGQYSEALLYYLKSIELKPDYSFAWGQIGWMNHYKIGDDLAAKTAYLNAIVAGPDGKWYFDDLADFYVASRQYDDAVQAFNQAIEAVPASDYAYGALADLYVDQQVPFKAITLYQQAIHLDPRNLDYYESLSEVYISSGDPIAAEEILRQAATANPENPKVYDNLAEYYVDAGKNNQAINTWQDGIQNTGVAEAYANLGDYYYYTTYEYKKALEQYQSALKLDPNYDYGNKQLGYIYHELRQENDVTSTFEAWITREPENDWMYAEIGNYYYTQGSYEKAERYLKEAIRLNPAYEYAYNQLGYTYRELGRHEDALASFEKASYFDLFEDDYYYAMAEEAIQLRREDQAASIIESALEINVVDPYTHAMVGNYYRVLMDDPLTAISYYQQALQLKPDYNHGWYLLGWTYHYKLINDVEAERAYLQAISGSDGKSYLDDTGNFYRDLGEYETAIEYYQKSLSALPRETDAYQGMGWTYFYMKDNSMGETYFKKAKDLAPHDAEVIADYANFLENINQDARAIELYKAALESDPRYEWAYQRLGWLYYNEEKYKEAVGNFKNSLAIDPDDANAYDGLGWSSYYLEDYQDALDNFLKAYEIDQDPSYINSAGTASYQLGNYQDAVRYHSQAIGMDGNYFYYYRRGVAFTALGRFSSAENDFKKAIALNPDYEYVYRELGDLYYDNGYKSNVLYYYQKYVTIADSPDNYIVERIKELTP